MATSEIDTWTTIQDNLTTNSRFGAYGAVNLAIKITGEYSENKKTADKAI